MPKTFKNFIFSNQIILATVIVLICFGFGTYLHTTLAKNEAIKNSNTISNHIFSSMYQVMRKGWSREDLELFTDSLEKNFNSKNYSVSIFRADKVNELFGEVKDTNTKDALIKDAFLDGQNINYFENDVIRSIRPLKASGECLKCHVNVKEGHVLGVIDVKQDLSEIFDETNSKYIMFFLIILPIFGIITFISSRYTASKLTNSIGLFKEKVEAINSVKEFKEFDSKGIDLYFSEMNSLVYNVGLMSEKLKKIAVDKELLEFEIRLLDKFIITSDVVKDWREYIKDLLFEINKIMPTYTLMTIFRVGDDQFEVDIFWLGVPTDDIKKIFEDYVHTSIKNSEHFKEMTEFKIKHNISDKSLILDSSVIKDIEYRSKSLFLDTPKIGGIVGIGLQSELASDPVRYIVIDSILTTMANLVGSVKAINKYTEDLEFYAARDPLTNLLNQRVFNDMLEYEIKRARRHNYEFGLMIIDCDNFKHINDNYGHAFGDTFLQNIADILEREKRDEDIVARYGGDEFAIILPECGLNELVSNSNKILNSIENCKLVAPDGKKIGMTISIGVSLYPHHAQEKKDLFLIADGMMYKAKADGKNSVKVPDVEDIEDIVRQKQHKSSLLSNAIENNQIIPYFQPIQKASVNPNGLEIHELLMRIKIEDKIISAFEFIEVAESMGLINKMDLIVIEQAFKKINESNYQGVLFINLSPKSLIVGNFINKINKMVDFYKISKEKIVFEITERETVTNFALLEKFVQNLKSEGYKFAIDDFGSGFSSFHYIKKFPIDYLKIDGDFIVNINKDEKDKAFVRSIVTLAKELEIEIIAEFVENEEIVEVLDSLEIDYHQGYHIGKPKDDFIKG